MFTGIIEALGQVANIEQEGANFHFTIKADFTPELKVDQSIAHNGTCLTVTELVDNKHYKVTAIAETLAKTSLAQWQEGTFVNLERCVKANSFLDGHIVQGHVDQTAICHQIEDQGGSWKYAFKYQTGPQALIVQKGSICVNGVSLTVVDDLPGLFSVAIIPYTQQHTNFRTLKIGDSVNIEFDIIGKYVAKLTTNKGLI